jgi:hypothetical protein
MLIVDRLQVRFIDAESATVAEEVFDHLQSAKLAIDAIHAMMATNYRFDRSLKLRLHCEVLFEPSFQL